MPRIARLVATGLPHHITQRGNYKQDIFVDDNDRMKYLSWIQEYSAKYCISILTYCLMQNHVHFIVIPEREDSLAKVFNAVHMRYSQYFNKKLKRAGHLWQGRFYSCILDDLHFIAACRYVERNPVRANIVNKPWQWEWSSASVHTDNNRKSPIALKNLFEIINDMSYDTWKEFIDSEEDRGIIDSIKEHTLSGRPLGAAIFIEKLQERLGRSLSVRPRGNPRTK